MADGPGATPNPETGNENPAKASVTVTDSTPVASTATEDAPLGEAGQKALDAWKDRAKKAEKEAKDAAAKVAEFEEKDASEVEKLTKRAERAEKDKQDAASKLLRFEVAAEKKVPTELTPLLTGSTKEELETQATLLLDNLNTAPKPDFDGGVREPAPETKTPESSHNDLAAALLGAPKQQP